MLFDYLFNYCIVFSLSLVMALNAFSIPDTNGKVCYKGGDKNQACKSNCPPCWKQESNNVFNCFEYTDGKCLFDWVDVSGNNDSGNSGSSASETTSSKKQSSKESSTDDKGNSNTSKGKGGEDEENTITSTVTSQINGKKSSTSTVVLVVTSSRARKTITAGADSGCQTNPNSNLLTLMGIVSLYHILN